MSRLRTTVQGRSPSPERSIGWLQSTRRMRGFPVPVLIMSFCVRETPVRSQSAGVRRNQVGADRTREVFRSQRSP